MLLDKVPMLKRADLVLASGSPRRVEILNDLLGLDVRVVASTFEENLDKSKYTPQQYGVKIFVGIYIYINIDTKCIYTYIYV